jgi:hypothetical protein
MVTAREAQRKELFLFRGVVLCKLKKRRGKERLFMGSRFSHHSGAGAKDEGSGIELGIVPANNRC